MNRSMRITSLIIVLLLSSLACSVFQPGGGAPAETTAPGRQEAPPTSRPATAVPPAPVDPTASPAPVERGAPPPAAPSKPAPTAEGAPTSQPIEPSGSAQEPSASVEAGQAVALSLPSGATLDLPQGALPEASEVALRAAGTAQDGLLAGMIPLGEVVEVRFGDLPLAAPGSLMLPFDPHDLPAGITPEQLFLARLDEAGAWQAQGGQLSPDKTRLVLSLSEPGQYGLFAWDWAAWSAALQSALPETAAALLNGAPAADSAAKTLGPPTCLASAGQAAVTSGRHGALLQACIDAGVQPPALRLTNPHNFYIEVRPVLATGSARPALLLAPGDSVTFQPETGESGPLTFVAELTAPGARRLALELLLLALPGQAADPEQLACLDEALGDLPALSAAGSSLLRDPQGITAGRLAFLLNDAVSFEALRQAAVDCGLPQAESWSLEGAAQLAQSPETLAAINQAVAHLAAFLQENPAEEFVFNWSPLAVSGRAQVGYTQSLWLSFNPTVWEALPVGEGASAPSNPGGEAVQYLRLINAPTCTIAEALGHGVPPTWTLTPSQNAFGRLKFRVETWIDTAADRPALVIYQYPSDIPGEGVRLELVVGENHKWCLENAAELLALNSDDIYSASQP